MSAVELHAVEAGGLSPCGCRRTIPFKLLNLLDGELPDRDLYP